jgi:hypothetical protein
MAESVDDITCLGDRESVLSQWGAGDVTAQALEAIALARPDADCGVQ